MKVSRQLLIILAAAVLLPGLSACTHGAKPGSSNPQAAVNQAAAAVQFSRVSLQRTACFGRCPVYQVSVSADGRVAYYGQRNVAVTGKHHLPQAADMAALNALWAMLVAADFMRLPDYVPGKPGCGTVTTDLPSVVISASHKGKTHRVRYYTGCSDAPQSLQAIADQIDKAANSHRWLENKAVK